MRVPVLACVALWFAVTAHAAPDVTPLASTPGLSSGFGEFRDAHFHAGLDYSTDEQEGRPVRAVNDGWVERVRASGVGYGRAVYLRLEDGRTVVYGHLSRFAPSIDAFVGARQESAGVYEQDLVPMPGLLKFHRGEIVAWSGQSGAGPPHLHFEVRRGDENFNPLLHGYALPDHIAPTLAAVWITPHGPHARVGGGIDEVRVALRKGAAVTAPPVRGDFDLAVDTWDGADGKPNKLATYRLEARVDGAPAPVFEAVIDSFSWDTTVEVERVYDYAATLRGDETRRTLEKLPSYRESVVRRGPAVWSLAPGTHRIELTAVDEKGNRATATLVVPVLAPGASASARVRRTGAHRGAEREFTGSGILRGTTLYAERPVSPGSIPAPALDGAVFEDSLVVGSRRTDIYAVTALASSDVQAVIVDSLRLRLVSSSAPGASGLVVLADRADTTRVNSPLPPPGFVGELRLDLAIPPHGLFDSTAVRLRRLPVPEEAGELIPISDAIDVAPASTVLRTACRIVADGGVIHSTAISPLQLGLFVHEHTGWSLVARHEGFPAYHGSTRRLGTFAVFADTTAPTIGAPRTAGFRWRHAPGDSIPPRLSVAIRDRGAGLAPADQSIFVDGRRVPAEYDPEGSRLSWYPRAWPAQGRHEVRIEAVDRLGNRSVLTVPLAVD